MQKMRIWISNLIMLYTMLILQTYCPLQLYLNIIKSTTMKTINTILQKMSFQKRQCQICFGEKQFKEFESFSKCGHMFCSLCLQNYIVQNIKSRKPIKCFNQECGQILLQQSPLIKKLPNIEQRRYYEALDLAKLTQDTNKKLCLNSKCQGFLDFKTCSNKVKCSVCLSSFCKECLEYYHQGTCEQAKQSIKATAERLSFKQCNGDGCKTIVERKEGCNKMTCLCGYQFCYICGSAWSDPHYECIIVAAPAVTVQQNLPLANRQINRAHAQHQFPLANNQPYANQMRSNCRLDQTALKPARQVSNKQPKEYTCPKIALVIFLSALLNLITCQIVWTLLIILVLPLLIIVALVPISIVTAIKQIKKQCTWKQILIFNFVLFFIAFGKSYWENMKKAYEEYESKISQKVIFPISRYIGCFIKDCLLK